HLLPCLLFRFGIAPADLIRHGFIRRSMENLLYGPANRPLRGIGFAVVFRNLRRGPSEELRHRVVAEMEVPGTAKIENTRQREHPCHGVLKRRKSEREMTSG